MFESIRKLKEQGKSQAAIARELGLDPKTVAKYVKANSPPRYKARIASTREDKFLKFEERVRQWLTKTPRLTCREIFELLLPEGYLGSERTVIRRMSIIRPGKTRERFFDQEYEMAEQAQFDFKEKVELPFFDGHRIVQLHFGTLPYSDTCYVKAYPFKNYECFIDGVHSFFEQIGGLTKNIRFDNLSPCVKKVLKGSERLYTDDFKKAIAHYGFGLLPCAPGKGNEKGDVERDIRTYSARIKNRVSHESLVFRDFGDLNIWLLDFMRNRMTESTKELYEAEREKLLPLPERDESVLCKTKVITTSGHGVVRLGQSSYSVPDAWIAKACEVFIGAYTVEIMLLGSKDERLVHLRKPDGDSSLQLAHILPSLVRKPHAMVRWAHREILFPAPVCHKFYSYLKKLDHYSAEREYLRSMNLVLQVELLEILAGMELVIEGQSKKPFEDIRDLLLTERRPCSVINIAEHLEMKPIKPELSIYDSLIPKEGSQ